MAEQTIKDEDDDDCKETKSREEIAITKQSDNECDNECGKLTKQDNNKKYQDLMDKYNATKDELNKLKENTKSMYDDHEIVKYLKQELPPLIIDTLSSSFIQHHHDLNNDDDVDSIKSEDLKSSSSHKDLLFKQKSIDDEMKETLQSNILQIIIGSKQEIIQHIDAIQEEQQNLTLKAKQKQLLEDDEKEQKDDEKEQKEYEKEQKEYESQQQQYQDSINELSVLLEPERIIDKLSTKLDNLLVPINNNTNAIKKYLETVKMSNSTESNSTEFDAELIRTNIKNDMESMLDKQRHSIGIDVSQTMRFLKDIKNEIKNPRENHGLDASTSIKPSYLKIGGTTFISTIASFLLGLAIFFLFINAWSQQMGDCQSSTKNGFINLKQKFDDLKIQILDSKQMKMFECENKLKQCMNREKENGLKLETLETLKKDLKELNVGQLALKYPEIYQ